MPEMKHITLPINEKCEWRRINKWQFGLFGLQSVYCYQYAMSPEQYAITEDSGANYRAGYSYACGVHN